jgi:hypothetical protein
MYDQDVPGLERIYQDSFIRPIVPPLPGLSEPGCTRIREDVPGFVDKYD